MRLKPDVIKLDRALTCGVDGDPVKAALIGSFVGYARDIHAVICAEGIETLDELTALADLDVAFGQGYGLARPGPPWPRVVDAAIGACVAAARASLAADAEHDGGLGSLIARLSQASTPTEIEACAGAIAAELHADEVRLAGPTGDGTIELLADDPAADPDAVAALDALGYGSCLTVPIVRDGVPIARLDAYARSPRPWTRFEIGRARIVARHLGAVLEPAAASA
jgi:GAF domain-containing protein